MPKEMISHLHQPLQHGLLPMLATPTAPQGCWDAAGQAAQQACLQSWCALRLLAALLVVLRHPAALWGLQRLQERPAAVQPGAVVLWLLVLVLVL
jgi:hypothetical protein